MLGLPRLLSLSLLTGLSIFTTAGIAADPFDIPTDPVLDISQPSVPALSVPAPFSSPLHFTSDQIMTRLDIATEVVEQVDVTDDVDFSFKPTGTIGPLLPGRHTITWLATDLGGNSNHNDLIIDIIPQINFSMDQTIGEGGTATLRALLSGTAPSYPVNITFNITNNNDGGGADDGTNDHSLAGTSGNLIFNDGDTEAQLEINIYADDDSGENENIILQLDIPSLPTTQVSLGYQTSHTIHITELAIPPSARLDAQQEGISTDNIDINGGLVTISAIAYDGNGETVSYDWSATDNALSPTTGTVNSSFIFDPTGLTPGYYTMRLTVNDSSNTANAQHLLLHLNNELPEFDAELDSDGDLLDDLSEGIADNDNDGIPDYLDGLNLSNQIQTTEIFIYDARMHIEGTFVSDSITLDWSLDNPSSPLILYPLLITVPAGLQLKIGPTAFTEGQNHAKLPTRQAEIQLGSFLDSKLVSSDSQMLDIEISQLANHGDLINIIIPQSVPILASAPGTLPQFYNYNNLNQWQIFVESNGEQIRTTAKQSDSFCPSFSNINHYTESLSAGDECLLISVRDGGPNDYDGLTNGSINLMGSVLVQTNSPVVYEQESGSFVAETERDFETLTSNDRGTSSQGITGGASLNWLILISLGLLLQRRR